MPKTNPTLLTRREREIMNAVFALGNRAPADEIRARLTNPPSDSAVRVMLARLEKKGCLKHQQDGARIGEKRTPGNALRDLRDVGVGAPRVDGLQHRLDREPGRCRGKTHTVRPRRRGVRIDSALAGHQRSREQRERGRDK